MRAAGHTLLEMLVVVAVLGTVVAVVGPRLGLASRTGLEAAARDVANRLQAARQEAVMAGGSVAVPLDRLPPDVRVVAVRVGGRATGDLASVIVDPVGDGRPREVLIEDAAGRRSGVTLPAGFAPPRVTREPGK